VVKSIRLNLVSPHLFLLHIEWEDGVAARPDVSLIWRGTMNNTNEAWSEEEDGLLAALYPEASQLELLQAFSRFSWYRICDRAKEHDIRRALPRQGRARLNFYHRTMTGQDLEAVAGLVQEPEKKERMQEIANALARETLRGELSAHWWLPLDEISYISDFEGIEGVLNGEGMEDGLNHPDESPPHSASHFR
jgi:hypothetical protein